MPRKPKMNSKGFSSPLGYSPWEWEGVGNIGTEGIFLVTNKLPYVSSQLQAL